MGQMMLLFSVHPFSCLFKTQECLCALTHTLVFETFIFFLVRLTDIFPELWKTSIFQQNLKTEVFFFANANILPFKIKVRSPLLSFSGDYRASCFFERTASSSPGKVKKWQMAFHCQ